MTSFILGDASGIWGGWANKKQCEKKSIIKLHSYEERLIIFMETLWQSITISVSLFFAFFCLPILSSSFKTNLNAHYRNWRTALILLPMRNAVHGGQNMPAPFSFSIKTTSTVLTPRLIDSRLSLSQSSLSL